MISRNAVLKSMTRPAKFLTLVAWMVYGSLVISLGMNFLSVGCPEKIQNYLQWYERFQPVSPRVLSLVGKTSHR